MLVRPRTPGHRTTQQFGICWLTCRLNLRDLAFGAPGRQNAQRCAGHVGFQCKPMRSLRVTPLPPSPAFGTCRFLSHARSKFPVLFVVSVGAAGCPHIRQRLCISGCLAGSLPHRRRGQEHNVLRPARNTILMLVLMLPMPGTSCFRGTVLLTRATWWW